MNDTSGLSLFDSSEIASLTSFSESRSPVEAPENGSRGTRTCIACMITKPSSAFYTNSKGGHRKKCADCCKAIEQKRKAGIKPEARCRSFQIWRRENRAKALLSQARYRAKQKGMEFELDLYVQLIQDVLDAGVCELTGIPFNFDDGKTWDSPSLDRIDSSRGYTLNNVRVVLYCINVMANMWGESKIIEIADAIMSARRSRSEEFQERLDAALKARIDLNCSPEYELTWSHWVTPAGRRISRLRASGLRISDSAYIGWPSPTSSNNGDSIETWEDSEQTGAHRGSPDTLNSATKLAGWTTPSAEKNTPQQRDDFTPCLAAQAEMAGWATPRTQTGGPESAERKQELGRTESGGGDLGAQAQLAGWITPNVPNGGRQGTGEQYREDGSKRQISNEEQAQMAGWGTPRVDDSKNNGTQSQQNRHGPALNVQAQTASGLTPDGTSAPTASGAGFRLNARFSAWMMGYPPSWTDAGKRAYSRLRRRKKGA